MIKICDISQPRMIAYIVSMMVAVLASFWVNSTMATTATYQVYIGYPRGYTSEYNNQHSVLKDAKGNIITRFGGDNATTGTLGSGVQNSPDAKMEVPSKIEVMWFSVAENQFWYGEFDVPTKQMAEALDKEKMLDVFVGGQGKTIDKYRQLVVNVAPKGKVYIYVSGAATKLMGSYQAKPIDYDWLQHVEDTWGVFDRDHIDTRQEFIEGMKKDYGEIVNNIEKNYNEGYFDAVHWSLKLEGQSDVLLAYVVNTLNGEYLHILKDPNDFVVRSIPTEIAFDFKYENEVKRYNIILPNLYDFYTKNFRGDRVVQIVVEIPNADQAAVYFVQGNKKIELEDFRIQELER